MCSLLFDSMLICSCTQTATPLIHRYTASLWSWMRPTGCWAKREAEKSMTSSSDIHIMGIRPLDLPQTIQTGRGKKQKTKNKKTESINKNWPHYEHFYVPPFSSEAYENIRYWEQFRQSHSYDTSAERWQKRRSRNLRLVGYCIIAMVLSVGLHVLFFR